MRINALALAMMSSVIGFLLIASPIPDDKIVHSIVTVIIEDYDRNKNYSVSERLVLSMSRKAFLDALTDWKKKYTQMPDIPVPLAPLIEDIVKTGEKRLDPARADRLRRLFTRLTFLSYLNFQMYYTSVKKYCAAKDACVITSAIIDDAISEPGIFSEKSALYDEEAAIKDEIRVIMKTPGAAVHFSFYAFAFDYVDKIRAGIIRKDMEAMLKKIEAKKNSVK